MPEIPQPGQPAPDFTLRDENNQPVTLSQLRGQPVVLFFYPLDFSPVCTTEMCTVRDDYSDFEATGARVFGISRDSVYAHRAFKESQGLKQTLLSDMSGTVARQYGVWNEQANLAERGTFIIDRDGIVRWSSHGPIPQVRDFNQALEALRAAVAS